MNQNPVSAEARLRQAVIEDADAIADLLREAFGFRRDAAGPHDLFGTPLFTMTKSLHA